MHDLDNIFGLQQVPEKKTIEHLSTHLIFVDLQSTYDIVPLKKLFSLCKMCIQYVQFRIFIRTQKCSEN